MFERDSIRVVEPSDDSETVDFEESDLPILYREGGWMLRYRDADGHVRKHLVFGEIEDPELAVKQARAYLDRTPRTTAWPHN